MLSTDSERPDPLAEDRARLALQAHRVIHALLQAGDRAAAAARIGTIVDREHSVRLPRLA